jgi:hypothetical protein
MAAAVAASACDADFESAEVVVDLRILGIRADRPEIVVPVDPDDPTDFDLADIADVEVCALVADPEAERGLRYRYEMCQTTGSGRCEPNADSDGEILTVELGEGSIDDPESEAPGEMCATIPASGDLVAVLQESASADDLAGFGGIAAQVSLQILPEDGGEDVFGFKRVRYSPQIPEERVANSNPTLDGFTAARDPTGPRGLDFELPLGRCGTIEPFLVAPRERITILPREPAGAREEYVVPTFDGGSRRYTENLTYQWHATAGEWSRFETGGTIDVAGNVPPLDSRWRAPKADEVGDGLDVRMWIVQRDERGGQAWFETCARVVP